MLPSRDMPLKTMKLDKYVCEKDIAEIAQLASTTNKYREKKKKKMKDLIELLDVLQDGDAVFNRTPKYKL